MRIPTPLFLFLVASRPALAQLFDKIEGLSQSTAYSVMRDRQGFLWNGTGDGLNRFDGVEVKVYRPQIGKKRLRVGRVRSDVIFGLSLTKPSGSTEVIIRY